MIQATNVWLQGVSKGDRVALNSVMDAGFIATTPVGDWWSKDDLIPDDGEVQRLPLMQMDNPTVRVYGDAAVLMARLKPADPGGTTMSGTFVYTHQAGWKLVALRLTRQK